MFEYLGLLLVLASWIAVGLLFAKWYDPNLQTISEHAASSKEALRIFIVAVAGFGVIFCFWLIKWFVPHLHLSKTFIAILLITITCQVIVALVPDIPSKRRFIHRVAGYLMALLYYPLAWLIITSPVLPLAGKIICSIGVICMLIPSVAVGILGMDKKHYLIYQTIFFMTFQLVILVGAYA